MITQIRGPVLAIGGALLASALCVGIAVGFLHWRAGAQRQILLERKERCERGALQACDLLRSACLKRSGEGCLALAGAYLATGPRHDGPEGARLLAEACDHHIVEGCRRAASLYGEGREVPADLGRAAALLKHACALGDTAACSKGP
jgi:TPR repeat protein